MKPEKTPDRSINGAIETGKPTEGGNMRAERKAGKPDIKPQRRKNSLRKKNTAKRANKKATRQQPELPIDPDKQDPSADAPQTPQSEYVRAFERLFRSFRRQVFEYLGEKYEGVIAVAEKKVRILSPEFDCHALTEEAAPATLELVEEIVNGAPFMKRSKLRRAAIALLSDLYNKQNNLLEQHRTIDRVEQVYYRLKK